MIRNVSDPRESGDETLLDPVTDDRGSARRALQLVAIGEGLHATYRVPDVAACTIGRAKTCDVHIDHPSISRRHAILRRGRAYTIEDLASRNGTRVGGAALAPHTPARIGDGDVIALGRVTFAVQAVEAPLARCAPDAETFEVPTGASATMQRVHDLAKRVAPGDISVLLLGETGVGKEVLARAVHRLSPRTARSFLGINCAALSETLLDAELFGHERGAFTGAVASKPGLLESAEGGTVFLDEVGEMPLATQAKLLRVLEERQVRRVGGTQARPIDVRFVAATNRALRAMVAEGRFREDLYFRLAGIVLTVPALRDRREEIEPLARAFASRRMPDGRIAAFSAEALAALREWSWPGNVRELRNVIERAVLLGGGGTILREHLQLGEDAPRPAPGPNETSEYPAMPTAPPPRAALRDDISALEKERIVEALERCGGNQTRAARMLGISRNTLMTKLDAYDIARPRVTARTSR